MSASLATLNSLKALNEKADELGRRLLAANAAAQAGEDLARYLSTTVLTRIPDVQNLTGRVLERAGKYRLICKTWDGALTGELLRCAAHKDGDCTDARCPQNRDGEPMNTGRHCPLDTQDEDDA